MFGNNFSHIRGNHLEFYHHVVKLTCGELSSGVWLNSLEVVWLILCKSWHCTNGWKVHWWPSWICRNTFSQINGGHLGFYNDSLKLVPSDIMTNTLAFMKTGRWMGR